MKSQDTLDSIIRDAGDEARLLGHNYVGTEHLLLALLNRPDVEAELRALDIYAGMLAENARRRLMRSGHPSRQGDLKPTSGSRQALDRVFDLARRFGTSFTPRHLLLALAQDDECVAGRLLEEAGLLVSELERRVTQ